jgi:hypothetical protein
MAPRDLPPEVRCTGTNRAGQQCGQTKGWGTDHPGVGLCKSHGGSTPSGKKAAQRMSAEQAVQRLGVTVPIDPIRALLDELGRAHAAVLFCEAQLDGLQPDQLVAGTRYMRRKSDGTTTETTTEVGPQLSVWVQLWHQERRALVTAAAEAVKAGAIDRQLALAEQQGELMGRMLRAVIDVLPEEARPAAFTAARAQLALVRAG